MQTSHLAFSWIFILTALLLGGIILTWLGLRGRRVDDHPLCRKCGFDLVGLPQGVRRCSECGADVSRPRAIRLGRRQRRPVVASLGLVGLLLVAGVAGVVGYGMVRNFDAYRAMPAWYLLRQARYVGATAPPLPAWNELVRRLRADQLSQAHAGEAVELALAIQQDRSKTWNTVFGDLVDLSRARQWVTDAQWQRYARQAPHLSLELRSRVRRGDHLPARIREGNARIGANSRFYVRLTGPTGEGDLIKPIDPGRHGTGSTGMSLSASGSGWSGQTIELDHRAAATAPLGVRKAKLRSRLVVREGWEEDQPALAEWDEVMSATWELVDAEAETIEVIEDKSHRAAVEQGTTVRALKWRSPSPRWEHVNLDLDFKSIPVPLAHEVVLRAPDGREWPLSGISLLPGNMGYGTGGSVKDFDANRVDVVFRPSPKVARDTVHMTALWNHEFVVPNVAVERPAPSTRPVGPASAPAAGETR